MKSGIKNIVFDVGMVLIDFCWKNHCRNLGFGDEVIETFDKNMVMSDCWDKMDEGLITEEAAIQEFIKAMPQYEKEITLFWSQPEGFVKEYSYATPMIEKLQQEGYKVYLLSNYPLGMYKVHWPTFSFYEKVDGYVVSAIEKMKKPNKEIYELLCNRYELNPEACLFVDDRKTNVEAAKSIGMEGVWFENYDKLIEFFGLEK